MKKAWPAIVGVALLFLPFPFAAQAQACTEIWCMEGLTARLRAEHWPAGRYRFLIEMDGKKSRCDSHLPFASCEATRTRCDSDLARIDESGCALPHDAHEFYAISSPTIPQDFSLTIEHESGKRFHYAGPVVKQCGYPNGKQCDPSECCSGTLDLPVVWE